MKNENSIQCSLAICSIIDEFVAKKGTEESVRVAIIVESISETPTNLVAAMVGTLAGVTRDLNPVTFGSTAIINYSAFDCGKLLEEAGLKILDSILMGPMAGTTFATMSIIDLLINSVYELKSARTSDLIEEC
jgi:hypothetical protein